MTSRFSSNPDSDLLMWDMVRALSIDLPSAIRDEGLEMETLREMIRNCAHCPEPQLCAVYLESRDGAADKPPSFCPNRKRLASLRAAYRAPEGESGCQADGQDTSDRKPD